jgi:3-oxoacyl-[acyl-carrier protein] reductase
MFDELKGKAVLVTGSSTGIGAAIAKGFGRLGATVVVHYNASGAAAEAVAGEIRAAGGRVHVVHGDVSDGAAAAGIVDQAAERCGGRLDILVNNAGGMVERRLIAEADDAVLDRVLDLNVRSVISATRAAIPWFRRQGRGNIVNISSIAARNGGSAGAGIYAAAKGFVSTLTHGLAKEHAKENIRVNAVSPGVILTPFHERYSTEAQLEAARVTIPMGRFGSAEECVGAVLFLATDALSAYVTGQVIEVNGGQLMP